MFKLDMNAIRKSANDTWLMANAANAANLANESGENRVEISQLAKLAISQHPNLTLQADSGNDPAPEPPTNPNAWRELATAYHHHHFACPVCIAAGRGAGYGLRCGVGAALWTSYQNT